MDTANTASQINLMEMAKQGDVNALAALMNRSLRVHGIFAELNLAQGCLVVSAMYEQTPPNKASLVDMLKRGLANLHPKGVQRVMIQAMSIRDRSISWQAAFILPTTKVEQPSSSALSSIAAKIPGLAQAGANTVIQTMPQKTAVLEAAPEAKAPPFEGFRKQAIGGYILLALGVIMMFTGLGQTTQTVSEDSGLIYDAAALANKAIHSEAGGAMMIAGAILIATGGRRS